MGGTTLDVSAMRGHQIIVTPDAMIHDDAHDGSTRDLPSFNERGCRDGMKLPSIKG